MKSQILIDTDIFSADIVDRAIKDYRKIALITKKVRDKWIECHFHSWKIDASVVTKEFENYLIELAQVI